MYSSLIVYILNMMAYGIVCVRISVQKVSKPKLELMRYISNPVIQVSNAVGIFAILNYCLKTSLRYHSIMN